MTNWPLNFPIYYVVVEADSGGVLHGYYSWFTIIRSIPCDIADVDQMYETHVAPLQASGRRVQSMIFRREPENPLKEQAQSENISR